jgi:MoxR-like ATPase
VSAPTAPADVGWFADRFDDLHEGVERFVVGKPEVVRLVLVCLLADGHVLIDDVPGVGKTSMAKAIAASLDATVGRIQFTPDLLPSDVIGTSVWRPDRGSFEFHEGPVFANIVLADEINRASPRTQSALLEVMEERQVTAGGATRPVPRPFLVIATQNPSEPTGTYLLPDSQLDRFLMRVSVGYPSPEDEAAVARARLAGHVPEALTPVADASTLAAMVRAAADVHIGDALVAYAVRLCTRSRELSQLRLGASPRASVGLLAAARVHAAARRRAVAPPDALNAVAPAVLGHRLLLTPEAEMDGATAGGLVARLLAEVAVPAAGDRR